MQFSKILSIFALAAAASAQYAANAALAQRDAEIAARSDAGLAERAELQDRRVGTCVASARSEGAGPHGHAGYCMEMGNNGHRICGYCHSPGHGCDCTS